MSPRGFVYEIFREENDSDVSARDFFAAPLELPFTPQAQCPYKFNAGTVGEALKFLLEDRSRFYNYHRETGSRLAWNVKAYRVDITDSEFKRTPELDEAWESYLDSNDWIHAEAYAQAQEYYREDWTSYPGDDQGDWKFSFGGRSGGWLCLSEWRGHKFERMTESEYFQFLAGLVIDTCNPFRPIDSTQLGKFYAAIVCADSDFTPKNAESNLAYAYAFFRDQWESERAPEHVQESLAAHFGGALGKVCTKHGVEFSDTAHGIIANAAREIAATLEPAKND